MTSISNRPKTSKRVFNLIIVDESGSMTVIQRQALAGMNETITTCQALQKEYPDIEQRITLLTFDSNHLTTHYDNVNACDAQPLAPSQYRPHAATPLYDAIGHGIAKVNSQAHADDTVLVTIITDGEENCSREYDLKMVHNLIEKLKDQQWTFTLIGTDNLDVEGMAKDMAIDNLLDFCQNAASTDRMFAKERRCRKSFIKAMADGILKSSSKNYFRED